MKPSVKAEMMYSKEAITLGHILQDKAQDSHRHGSKLWQLDLEILSEVAKKELGGAALMAGGGVHACAVVWAGIMRGCSFPLQRLFPTQGSNLHLLHLSVIAGRLYG